MQTQRYTILNNKQNFITKCGCTDHVICTSPQNLTDRPVNGMLEVSLDKLAQLRKTTVETPEPPTVKATLTKRAKRKYLTMALTGQLLTLNSRLHKSYLHTVHCGSTITQRDGRLTSSYCNHRWCVVCGSIRTAKAINGYLPQLQQMQDPYFVTLTAKNVHYGLRDEVGRMQSAFKQIMEVMRKRGTPIRGLRKLEITHGKNGYNPHYHIIIDGRDIADEVILQWLKRNQGARIEGQNIRKADQGAMLEILKYSTKLTAKAANVVVLDEIFMALEGKRTLQPMGGIRRVNDQVTELDAVVETDQPHEAVYAWQGSDWFNVETGEALTGFVPDNIAVEIANGYFVPPELRNKSSEVGKLTPK